MTDVPRQPPADEPSEPDVEADVDTGHRADDELDLAGFADACAVAPERIERFVLLGILDPAATSRASSTTLRYTFTRTQTATVARIQRLHHGLDLPYRAVGVVADLLDRIDALEAELRHLRR